MTSKKLKNLILMLKTCRGVIKNCAIYIFLKRSNVAVLKSHLIMSAKNQLLLHLVGQILNTKYFNRVQVAVIFLPFPTGEKKHKRLCSQQLDYHDIETRISALSINSACVLNYLETLTHTH